MTKRTLVELFGPSSSSSSEEESDDEISQQYHAVGLSRRTCGGQGLWFSQLSDANTAKLSAIKEPADQRLQQLLWELGCCFQLFCHQFKGVRDVTGVSASFPGPEMVVKGSNATKAGARLKALENAKPRLNVDDFGLILADSMGLGKTIQAVAAVVLRNAIATARGEVELPSLIVCPNEAVLIQWKDHFRQGGVSKRRIIRFKTKQPARLDSANNIILCTRYDLQAELHFIMRDVEQSLENQRNVKSTLFPGASDKILDVFLNQYQNTHQPVKNEYNTTKEGRKMTNECVITEYLAKEKHNHSFEKIFRTIIIDEVHFLKNLKTYWAMAAGLICLHSERIGLLTGTPFNNSCQDMAAMMTFINPSDKSARLSWWLSKMKPRIGSQVQQALSTWSSRHILRREKDVISHLLKQKYIRKMEVKHLNLQTYQQQEEKMFAALKRVHYAAKAENKWLLQEAVKIMLGCAAKMQLSLVHPVLPEGGRQLTVHFSPSRQTNQKVKTNLENPYLCVRCLRRISLKSKPRSGVSGELFDLDEEPYDDLLDKDVDSNLSPDNDKECTGSELKGHRNFVPIDEDICVLAKHGVCHFACESCLAKMKKEGESCPKCSDLFSKANFCSGSSNVREVNTSDDHIYCKDILGGFKASAKLRNIVHDFLALPKDKKAMIASFYKGPLDLLEAMFLEHGIKSLRFDGDVSAEQRQDCLKEFKTSPVCRVLLMTAQTGGTGLNITEATNGFFTERYWNPMVLDQCEDRLYRIGQKDDVDIAYYDVPFTIDDLMWYLNTAKRNNASIILSDTVALHDARMNYKELSGFLGMALEALREARSNPLECSPKKVLDGVIKSMRSSNKSLPSFLLGQHDNEEASESDADDYEEPFLNNPLMPSSIPLTLDEDTDHEDFSLNTDKTKSSGISTESSEAEDSVDEEILAVRVENEWLDGKKLKKVKVEPMDVASSPKHNRINPIKEGNSFDETGCEMVGWICTKCRYLNEGDGTTCGRCEKIAPWPSSLKATEVE